MSSRHSGSAAEASLKGPFYPLGYDGPENTDTSGTATCFCGAVRLAFPTEKPGFVDAFICNCSDCRKITASTFASNFVIRNDALTHVRGEDKLTKFEQSKTIDTENSMANFFCSICGTLMYRRSSSSSGNSILRIGTVDNFNLHETKLRPRIEQFTKDRVSWCTGAPGVEQYEGNYYGRGRAKV